MESRKKIESIVQQLAENLNLKELKLNKDGYCSITFDEKIVISFEYFSEKDELFIYSPLGEVPADKTSETALYKEVLAANFFWQGTGGATISLESKSKMLVAFKKFKIAELDYSILESELEVFVNFSEVWFHRLRDLDFPTSKKTATPSPTTNDDGIKV